MKYKIFYALVGLLFLSGCAGTTPQKAPLYEGYNFDAMVNDALVIPLKSSAQIPSLQSYHRDVTWQLDKPIHGMLTSKYKANSTSPQTIGKLSYQEPMQIIPLQYVKVATNRRINESADVSIGGNPVLSRVNVLKKNILPAGEYVFRFKVHGTKNWDRKEIYVQVN